MMASVVCLITITVIISAIKECMIGIAVCVTTVT